MKIHSEFHPTLKNKLFTDETVDKCFGVLCLPANGAGSNTNACF